MKNLNQSIFLKIYNKRNRFLTIVSWFASNGSFLFLFFACFFIFLVSKRMDSQFVVKLLVNGLLAIVFVKIIVDGIAKKFYFKPRPHSVIEKIDGIGKKENNSTLPSGHVTMVTAVALTLIFYSPILIFLILTIPLVAWSRIYNGMHWPFDVLIGFFLGAFIANISFTIVNLIF